MRRAITIRRLVDGRVYERKLRGGGWLTTDEVIRLLGRSRRTVFYMIRRGSLHPRKLRGRLRFRVSEVATLMRGEEVI